ncbi:MAG: hypothetical protein F6K24_29405, partial [Okeania sp. SIO2D1]|nr:hypothetical protein [Okeania sp. SIO2D1]
LHNEPLVIIGQKRLTVWGELPRRRTLPANTHKIVAIAILAKGQFANYPTQQ